MTPDLEKLLALHDLDQKFVESRSKVAALAKDCEKIEADYQEFAAGYLTAKEKVTAAQKRLRQLEEDLAETQQRHEKYTADLMKVRNQKEYGVALHEIDVAKKAIGQFETQILEAMEEAKTLETELSKFSPDIENKRQEADTSIAACREQQAALEAELETYRSKRSEIEAMVTKPWLDRYNRVAKLRAGSAMAEARNGACSACRMTLRPQVWVEVRQGEIIYVCDHCSRILYHRPEAKVETMEA